MSARLLLIGSAFLVASCATVQENPNYQHSTKYGADQTQVADNSYHAPNTTPRVQTAGAQTNQQAIYSADPQTSIYYGDPVHHAGTQTATTHTNTGYLGNEGVTIAATHPDQPTTSPTERAYNSNQMQGTPGYEMMRAQQDAGGYSATPAPEYASPAATPPAIPGPRQIAYDYGDNVSRNDGVASQSSVPSYDQMREQGRSGTAASVATGQSYMVREGDTIYSLSRRLCTPIADITTPNAIGGDFAIAIGQTLNLPASRC
jgi:LysM repeat protein